MDNSPEDNLDQVETKSAPRQKDFSYFSDVLKMLGGNGFSQAFKTLISPVLSRLYLPEFFGVLQNFSSIANIFSIISSLRYDATVVLPKKDEQAVNQFAVSIFFILLTTPIAAILVYFFKDDAARILKSPGLENYLWFIPLYVFALGSFNALKQWNTRKREFLRLSAAQVASEVVSDGLSAGLGFAGLASSNSLILARIFGQLSASATLAFLILKQDGKFILENIRWKLMLQGIKTYKKFPLYNIWAAFLSNLTLYIPGLMLSSYFSPREAGFFAMGNNVLRLPISLVGTSIGQVFAQRSAKSFNEGRLKQTVLDTYKRLVVFGLFPMLLVGLIGKELFIVVFGDKWADAGVYSQILCLWTFFYFLVSPISNLTNVLGKNEASLLINLIRAVTSVIALLIGGMTKNIILGLWLLAISGSLTYAIFVVWINRLSGIAPSVTIKIFLTNLALCVPFLIAIQGFRMFNPLPATMLSNLNIPLNYVGLIFFAGVTAIGYFLVVLRQDKSVREAAASIFNKFLKNR